MYASSSNLDITKYDIRYYCANCWTSWFTSYLYPSSLGSFGPLFSTANSKCIASSYTPIKSANLIEENTDFKGSIVTCVEMCEKEPGCLSVNFDNAYPYLCKLYSEVPTIFDFSGSNCMAYTVWVSDKSSYGYYEARSSDTLGYDAKSDTAESETIDLRLGRNYDYYVSYRVSNGRGASVWSADLYVEIKIDCTPSLSSDMKYFKYLITSTLKVGEQMRLKVYEDNPYPVTDELLCDFLVSAGSGGGVSGQVRMSDCMTSSVYHNEDNTQHLYYFITYADYNFETTEYVPYNPVNSIVFTASSNTFTFKADTALFTTFRVLVCYYSYTCLTYAYQKSYTPTSVCSGTSCTIIYGSNVYGGWSYNYFYLYATDELGKEINVGSGVAGSFASSQTVFHNASQRIDSFVIVNGTKIDANSDVDIISGSTFSSTANQNQRPMPPQSVRQLVLKSSQQPDMAATSKLGQAATNRGDMRAVRGPADSRQLTTGAVCSTSDPDGLSYSIYYGCALSVGMNEVSIPSLGLVLFDKMTSPDFTIKSPTQIGGTFGDGCLHFPPLEPQVNVISPASTDSWGVGSTWHTVQWNYWALDKDELIEVCFATNDNGNYNTVKCDNGGGELSINTRSYTATISLGTFEVGTEYYVSIKLISSGISYGSGSFLVVESSEDKEVGATSSFSAAVYDDVSSFSGEIYSLGSLSINLREGTNCQSKYSAFPLNVLCKVDIDLLVSDKVIYSFTINGGAEIPDENSLSSNGIELNFGLDFPAFSFPDGVGSSYFYSALKGVPLTQSSQFPITLGADMYKLNLPSNKMCLKDLLDYVQNIPDVNSDMVSAAQSIQEFIDMLAMEACITIVPDAFDTENYGISFNIVSDLEAFVASKIDWSKFFDSIENPTFQGFLLLSGAASEDMASSTFDEILKLLGLPTEGITYFFI
jgi:hypothetical protein